MHLKAVTTLLMIIAGYFSLGIAHIAVLPVFEGFDETAHYSYIQEISDTHSIPRHYKSKISKDIYAFRHVAPTRYKSLPPYDHNGAFTYKSFFSASPETINIGHSYIHKKTVENRSYLPGEEYNWQVQHPPLYYLIMAPLYLMTKNLSWGNHIFILRLISYSFAMIAFAVSIFCNIKVLRYIQSPHASFTLWIFLGVIITPILLPTWFPEMARIGNDSLCALLMSLVWVVSIYAYKDGINLKYSLILGLLLGLGCLTKAFFVPITVGVVFFWCIRQYSLEKMGCYKSVCGFILIVSILVCTISGWWYLLNWYEHRLLFGSWDMLNLKYSGGMIAGLKRNFSLTTLIRGHISIVTTLGWSGTWSMVRPPYLFLAPMAGIVLYIMIAYMTALFHFKPSSIIWMPFWYILPILGGLSHHVLVVLALTGSGSGTPGWYLLIFIAPLGLIVSAGFGMVWRFALLRVITICLFFYALYYSLAITYAQIMLFSGIMFKAGVSKFYQMTDPTPPFLGLIEAYHRLKIIAFPSTGILAFIIGAIMISAGIFLLAKNFATYVKTDSTMSGDRLWK